MSVCYWSDIFVKLFVCASATPTGFRSLFSCPAPAVQADTDFKYQALAARLSRRASLVHADFAEADFAFRALATRLWRRVCLDDADITNDDLRSRALAARL